ncbi:hypothetical protein SYNPS1DRAFT_22570 [Syncephalis pseudoplumigaleata]|uniref:Uncharacterized protein n=1 Tax=Syncephalis pseudoplumigaleata TaxID=1712513 RepID=A0A4P9YZF2_9FUNG|nr:hypothetical protein SYNPS1DRAFT_22570 [Syncephalis pseudoplumigaleata]|eukprot:RKP25474.1 hypothetical protein SYNPS1DRAFT_22570 [Syncephalis pseudoplumigaleata]
MLTIFWSLTIGPDEPLPLLWRQPQHPCNLPPLLTAEQLEKMRQEQRARQEATSRARREVRRVLGVSRHKTLILKHQRYPFHQIETIDTLLLHYLLSYPCRALRLRYYAVPHPWHAHRLRHPVAYIMALERTRQQFGLAHWWRGSVSELLHYTITRSARHLLQQQRKESRSTSSAFVAGMPFYRAFIFQSVLATMDTTQWAPALQQELAQHSSILGQWQLWLQAVRQPTATATGRYYWQHALPASLLYYFAESSVASSDTMNRRRRRLWRSCVWSATHLSAMLLTRTILAPLEAFATRITLAGSPLAYPLPVQASHTDGHGLAGLLGMVYLAVQPASWSGLIGECLLAVLVAQVDWLVCRQVIRWRSAPPPSSTTMRID